MSRSKSRPVCGQQSHGRLLAGALTFFATLVAAPGYAVDIPNVPLQSQAEYPPANVMFILDDSGSMAWDFMPGAKSSSEIPKTSPVESSRRITVNTSLVASSPSAMARITSVVA